MKPTLVRIAAFVSTRTDRHRDASARPTHSMIYNALVSWQKNSDNQFHIPEPSVEWCCGSAQLPWFVVGKFKSDYSVQHLPYTLLHALKCISMGYSQSTDSLTLSSIFCLFPSQKSLSFRIAVLSTVQTGRVWNPLSRLGLVFYYKSIAFCVSYRYFPRSSQLQPTKYTNAKECTSTIELCYFSTRWNSFN